MKKTLLVIAVIAAAVGAVGAVVAWRVRSQSPEALLDRLARGKGDREELVMRLNVVRGDVVGPMIRALEDRGAPADFRADILELLLKRNFRAREERIERAILRAASDPEPVVRRKAVYGIAVYVDGRLQACLVDRVADPDLKVRRQVYMTLGGPAPPHNPEEGIWEMLSPEQQGRLVEVCLERMKTEKTPEMRDLARAIIGKEIEIRGVKAVQALQGSEVEKAEKLLRSALALDPANCQGQVRLVRFFLTSGRKDEALRLARQYGALIEVPRLSRAPSIDGDPTDEVWAEAYSSEKFYRNDSRWFPRPAEGRSKAFLGHHGGKLYVAVLGYEDDLSRLARKHTSRDSDVWRDDCVELFFDPGNTGTRAYQFVMNPAGALADYMARDKGKNFNCSYKVAAFPDRKESYWACEFAVDGKDLGDHPVEPGAIWSLDVFRTRVGLASEQCALWPVFGQCQRSDIYPLALFK